MKRSIDVSTGVFFIVLGALLFWRSQYIEDFISIGVGAAFAPRLVAILFLAVGAFIAASPWMSSERVAFADASSADEVVFGDMRSLFLSLMLMIAYLLLLQSVGFILDTIVYAFLQIMILDKGGKRKWLSSLVISIASVVVIDYLFEYVFGVALPSLQLF